MATNYNSQSIFSLPCAPQAITSLGNGCGFVILCSENTNNYINGYVMAIDGSNVSDIFAPFNTPINTMYPLNLYNKTTLSLLLFPDRIHVKTLSYSNEGQLLQRSEAINNGASMADTIQMSYTEEFNVVGLINSGSSFTSFDNNLNATTYSYLAYSSLTNPLWQVGNVYEQYFTDSKKLVLTVGSATQFGNINVFGMVYNTVQSNLTPLSGPIQVSNTSTVNTNACTTASTLIDGLNIAVLWQSATIQTNFYFQIITSNGTLALENEVLITTPDSSGKQRTDVYFYSRFR